MNKIKHLTQRDKELLALVDNYGLISTSQIKKLLFSNVHQRTMLRRLQILKGKNFLQRVDGLPRGEQSWFLTNTSTRLIGSSSALKGINKNTLYHDIKVNDLRMALESTSWTNHWKNGHWLAHQASLGVEPSRRFKTIVPDSIFVLDTFTGPQSVALELELVKKAKKRYQHLFQHYLRKTEINMLWYVVPTKKMGEHLISLVPTHSYERSKPWFYWSLLDEVLQNSNEVLLHGKQGSLTLKQVCKPEIKNGLGDPINPQGLNFTPAHSDAHPVTDSFNYDDL